MKLWSSNKSKKPGDMLSNWQKEVGAKMPKNINLKLPTNLNVTSLKDLIRQAKQILSSPHQPGPTRSGIPMKYPYTLGAKIAQFPFKFYYQTNWIARYYPLGIIVCAPLFWYISRMVNSKENKAKWKQIRRLEKEEARHKFDY